MVFMGKPFYIHDISSFYLGKKEIFHWGVYKFQAENDEPYIIDCGANLGMSIIYFKKLYPKASITAFEADDYIFSFLEKNIKSFQYNDVELVNNAVWNKEEELSFFAEGGAGGRLEVLGKEKNIKTVKATRLKNWLKNKKIDFLKIDIEGAESEVIDDCKDELKNVEKIFIEYHSFNAKEQNLHRILMILHMAGFRYHIKEAFTRQFPFIDKDLNVEMDLQLNIFGYRDK
ncbi:hypothetical protein GCM10010465_26880 [Actinomadura fibrosa]